MEAYIERGKYRSDFDKKKHINKIKDLTFDQDVWDGVLKGDSSLNVVLPDDQALYLYGVKASLLKALQKTRETVGGHNICDRFDRPLMAVWAFVTPDGGKKKRVVMICERTDERVAELGEGRLIPDPDGNTSFETLNIPRLMDMIDRLPSSSGD
jgi:hypothetical protein